MGGGGGKPPEPKTFVSPPIDNSPATHPIPNFFADRPNVSPYAVMAALQQVQRPQPFQQFGAGAPPTQFTMPQMIQRQFSQAPVAQTAPDQQAPAPLPDEMTKQELMHRLGKGGR